jgi:hypothetical protein
MYRFIKITPNYLKLLLQETKYNKNLVERHASQPRKRLFIFLTTPLDKEPKSFNFFKSSFTLS